MSFLKKASLPTLFIIPLYTFPTQAVEVTDELDIGGAVRVNYAWKDYDNNAKLEFELFRADVNYKTEDGLFASAQYRWYQDMDVIHHAYMGYQFDETQSIKVGVTQVPFGFLPMQRIHSGLVQPTTSALKMIMMPAFIINISTTTCVLI